MTTRVRVLVEGRRSVDNRYVEPGATTWPDRPLVLMRQRESEVEGEWLVSEMFGSISEIRREEDGTITGLPSREIPAGMVLGADLAADKIEYEVEEWDGHGSREPWPTKVLARFTAVRLLGATIIPATSSAWPEEASTT